MTPITIGSRPEITVITAPRIASGSLGYKYKYGFIWCLSEFPDRTAVLLKERKNPAYYTVR